MKESDFWKNFKLGEEISVSGAFIYNGLRRYHEMRNLDFTDEVFEFLYNLSVGFERLLKIAVVLFEHDDSIDQSELERSLITHSHLDLLARLKKHENVNLGPPQIDLLALLGKFYKSFRYDRFSISSVYDAKKEKKAICALLQKHLQVEFPEEVSILGTQNEDRYRRFIRKTILSISRTIYEIVEQRARSINLYTYELRHGSKSESVFLREIDISEEDVLWKELLVFFMNTKFSSGYLEFLRQIPPLDFDPGLVGDYLDCFQSDAAKAFVMDELEHHYTEMEVNAGDRLKLMSVIGASNVCFDLDDDEYNEEELQ